MPGLLEQLSIIIPSYNGIEALRQTLETLDSPTLEAEVIVVDGGSSDGSRELVLERFPKVQLLDVPNHGYSHALNRGIEVAHGDVLLLMNSDVLIARNTLEALVGRLTLHRSLGAVGPHLMNAQGQRQFSFGPLYWPNWFTLQHPMRVGVLHGSFIATRRDVLERVGGFDERFFFYNEELDWCWRVRNQGLDLEVLPETAIHLGGASTPSTPNMLLEGHRGGLLLVSKHFHPLIAEVVRLFAKWLARVAIMFAQPDARAVWKALGEMAQHRMYTQSPFALSGRGEVHFKPRVKVNA